MPSTPKPREPRTFYGDAHASHMGETWIEAECLTYPSGGFHRRGYVRLRRNPNNPLELPYGEMRIVKLAIPDTYFSISARLKYKGRTVRGFVSVVSGEEVYTFTPDALTPQRKD